MRLCVGLSSCVTERIEACVTEMRSWTYTNKLQLNDAKTEVILICSVYNQSKFNVSHIQVGVSEIRTSTCETSAIRLLLDRRTTATLVHAYVT